MEILILYSTGLLVFIGFSFLIFAIKPTFFLSRVSKNPGWKILLFLILGFIAGYAFFFHYVLSNEVNLSYFGFSLILFGGGVFVFIVIQLSLVTTKELKSQVNAKYAEARRDSLTGLSNRLHFMEKLDQIILNTSNSDSTFALVMIDLNKFKEINDSLGHAVGDKLLQELACRLINSIHSDYSLARLGGDEFALLIPDSDEVNALIVSENLKSKAADLFTIGDHLLSVEMSVGISFFPEHASDRETLLISSDIAMYESKKNNGKVTVFSKKIRSSRNTKNTLQNDIKTAISNNELELYYQPIFNASDTNIYGFEALLRWRDKDKKLIKPEEFLPQIEQTKHMKDVTYWLINKAILDLKNWNLRNIKCYLNINLSTADLQNNELAEYIKQRLKENDIEAKYLCFEITEKSASANMNFAKSVINDIISVGCSVAIDNFATGYSSLRSIIEIKSQIVKIDKSYIGNFNKNIENYFVIKSIVNLCHTLNKKVVIVGIEKEDTIKVTRRIGCDYVQGNYFSIPRNFAETTKWISRYKINESSRIKNVFKFG